MTEYVNQCGRCGSSLFFTDCIDCDGAGFLPDDDLGLDAIWACEECDGDGFIAVCMSTRDWCQDHPRPGCEHVPSGTVGGIPLPPADESGYGPDARPIPCDRSRRD